MLADAVVQGQHLCANLIRVVWQGCFGTEQKSIGL